MATRMMALRRAGSCRQCSTPLPVGTRALWDAEARHVICERCVDDAPVAPPLPPPVDRGQAGASAEAEYRRRQQNREAALEDRWGRLAGVAKFLSTDPQTTTAWGTGAEGERKAAAKLGELAGPHTQFLFDRKVPRTKANIDLLAVAPTGVWVIDAKKLTGQVERRDVGGLWRTDLRLYVGSRDQSKLVKGMQWQVDVVRAALGDVACEIRGALCFVDAEWKAFFARPFDIDGVHVSSPRGIGNRLRAEGPLGPAEIDGLVVRLANALPPAVPTS